MTRTLEVRAGERIAAARLSENARPLRQLGPWELLRPVGHGSLAEVFAARPAGNASARAAYAVKELRERWHADIHALALFQREAIVGRSVVHPHLVSILSAHTHDEPYYLVMPLLEGETLDVVLRRLVPPLATTVWIARQVAEALDALHRNGWMHADVKPANILVAPSGHVTLLDLGFARRIGEAPCAEHQPLMGTINYLAPELVLRDAAPPDARSDLYSLGVTLFEMLIGRPPRAASTIAELAEKFRHRQRLALDELVRRLPLRLLRLVESLLAYDPLRRPDTASEVISRLVSVEIETLADRIAA